MQLFRLLLSLLAELASYLLVGMPLASQDASA